MDIRKLQRAIVDGLEDVKAQDIQVYNTEHLSPLFERVIIASGTSNRQTKALASSVRDAVKSQGLPVLATEGGTNGEWIIVDCGAAVAHIMQPAIREYYRLEEIWGGKPVKLKLGNGAPKGLPKASEEDQDDGHEDVEAPSRSAPEKRAADGKATAGKASAKKATAKHAAAKEAAPARKASPAKKPTAGRAGARPAPRTAKAAPEAPSKAPSRSTSKAPAKAAASPKAAPKRTGAAAPRKAASAKAAPAKRAGPSPRTASAKAAPAKAPARKTTPRR